MTRPGSGGTQPPRWSGSGDLCDAVTGRPGGQAMLERIERAGLFLVPLDEVRGWWRYHHLFADLLQARLAAEQRGRARALHRAAAAWHAERGLADDAVRHAVAAGEREQAAELIEQHFDVVYFTGESATLQRWLSALPADFRRSRPRLSLAQAFMALTGGDVAAAQSASRTYSPACSSACQRGRPRRCIS
jgi:LuxR family maltose regulon positive regulatory protein